MLQKQHGALTVGVISDIHGPLSGRARRALKGVDRIVCAGDSVDPFALQALMEIAPTTAVRGNMDSADVGPQLPQTAVIQVGGVTIYVLHDLYRLDLDPQAAGIRVVVHGHTHVPEIIYKNDVLYLNPGSAGPPRSSRSPSLARLRIQGEEVFPEIVYLK